MASGCRAMALGCRVPLSGQVGTLLDMPSYKIWLGPYRPRLFGDCRQRTVPRSGGPDSQLTPKPWIPTAKDGFAGPHLKSH